MASDTKGVTGLTGRYANALFGLAEEQGVLDLVAEDLRVLAELIQDSDDLKRMLRSPIISRAEQRAAMEAVLETTGASDLTKKFVGLTSSNRRLFVLKDIIVDYLTIVASHRGEATVEVISAAPLNNQQTDRLLKILSDSVGGKVNLISKLDPGLLGGLVVKIGSRMVNSSLSNKLQQLRLAMRGVG